MTAPGEPRLRWFGRPVALAVCQEGVRVPPPYGAACGHCGEVFRPREGDDRGVYGETPEGPRPLHWECWFREIFGSLGHLRRACSCYGGTEEDPPGLSLREAARAAWDHGYRPPG